MLIWPCLHHLHSPFPIYENFLLLITSKIPYVLTLNPHAPRVCLETQPLPEDAVNPLLSQVEAALEFLASESVGVGCEAAVLFSPP